MKTMTDVLATNSNHENWIPLIDTAAREVFELMLSSKLTAPSSPDEAVLDVTAMVGLAGQLCGVLCVRCDTKAASMMASRMLGIEVDKVGPEVSDALGEVCNMVAGNFKNKIAGLAEGCMLSPPTVITGSDYEFHAVPDSPSLDVKLLFEGKPILISLQVHS